MRPLRTPQHNRLREVRERLGLNQEVFSQSLKTKRAAYAEVERGRTRISQELMVALIDVYNVNPNFIYLGHEPMFLNEDASLPNEVGGEHFLSLQNEARFKDEQIKSLQKEVVNLKALLDAKDKLLNAQQQLLDSGKKKEE